MEYTIDNAATQAMRDELIIIAQRARHKSHNQPDKPATPAAAPARHR